MNDTSKVSGASRDREAWFRVVENQRLNAVLPSSDQFLQTLTEHLGIKRSPIEQDGIDDGLVVQKFRQITGDRAVGGVRQCPFSQSGLTSGRFVTRIAFGKKTVQDDRLDLGSLDLSAECAAKEA